jgi:glycogen debranching enzyme
MAQEGTPWVPRFEIADGPLTLRGPARPGKYFDALGRRAGLLGFEQGVVEAWVYPMQIAHGLRLAFQPVGSPEAIDASRYAAEVTVRPEAVTITYSHPLFTVRQHLFTPLEEEGSLILLDVDSPRALTVVVSFFPDLKPMWPAGLGGQYAFWDGQEQAYVLSESRRKFNAFIGTPGATALSSPPAHELATTPNRYAVTVSPDSAARYFVSIAIAASVVNRDSARATYRRLIRNAERLYRDTADHYDSVRTNLTRLRTPEAEFDLAFEWAKVALDKGMVFNPHLGRGLVAGYGPSGASQRPGFAWFFGGDAFINSAAMIAYGDFASVRQAFTFLQKRQRADGKMMHELSQSAGLIRWFEEYPYGYIHGDTTPFYLVAVRDYVRFSGDTLFVRQSWDSLRRAYLWCRSTDSDGDGLMENTLAGLGASELGSLREASGVDVFLASVGVQAWRAFAELAQQMAESELAAEADRWFERGRAALEKKFWNAERQSYNFSLTREGNVNDEVTAWAAFPAMYKLVQPKRARQTLALLASEQVSTDWGARMLWKGSEAYDPLAYNNGAVWPFLTGYVILANYANDRPASGYHSLRSITQWSFHDALGYQPEVVSGDYFRVLETSVPHQLFSSTAVAAGVLRGLLGWQADAVRGEVVLAPSLPAEWDSLQVRPLWVGKQRLDAILRRTDSGFRLAVELQGDRPLRLRFAPVVGYGAEIEEVRVDGEAISGWESSSSEGLVRCQAMIDLEPGWTVVEVQTQRAVEVAWPWLPLRPGDSSHNLKPLEARFANNRLVLRVEGRSGRKYDMRLRTRRNVASVNGAALIDQKEGWTVLRLRFARKPQGYRVATVTVRFTDK